MNFYSLSTSFTQYQHNVYEGLDIFNFAKGFRSGAGVIKSYRLAQRCAHQHYHFYTWLCTSWGSIKTSHRMWTLGLSVNLIRKYQMPVFMFTGCLFLINTQTWIFKAQYRHSNYGKFCAAVWRMTPLLLVIANVAVIAIEASVNPAKATIAAQVLCISILDYQQKLPPNVSWLLNKVLPLPIAAIAMYAGGPITRTLIGAEQLSNFVIPRVRAHYNKTRADSFNTKL